MKITKIIENPSQFSGCANSCNKFVSIRYWQTWNYLWYCYEKVPPPRLHPVPFERARGAMPPLSGVPVHNHKGLCLLLPVLEKLRLLIDYWCFFVHGILICVSHTCCTCLLFTLLKWVNGHRLHFALNDFAARTTDISVWTIKAWKASRRHWNKNFHRWRHHVHSTIPL